MRKPAFRFTIIHVAMLVFVAAMLALLLACTVRKERVAPTPRAKYTAVFTTTPYSHGKAA